MGVAVAGVYFYVRLDDEIRQHVRRLLEEGYPGLNVSVDGARLVEGKGIAVYGLTLGLANAAPGGEPLLAVEEVMLACDVDVSALVGGRPPIHRIELRRPHVSLQRSATGRWNFQSLLPMHSAADVIPPIVVHGGIVSISDAESTDRQPLVLRDIELIVTPSEEPAELANQQGVVQQSAQRASPIPPPASRAKWPSVRIEGAASGPALKQINVRMGVDGSQGVVTIAADLRQFQLNEQILLWLRQFIPQAAANTRLTALIDGQLAATWRRDSPWRPDFTADLQVASGRLEDPRLPQPVTDIVAKIKADASQLQVQELHGKWNSASVALSLNRTGWASRAPLSVAARADNVVLDEHLYDMLASFAQPKAGEAIPLAGLLCEQLDKYQPTGIVDAVAQVAFDGLRWTPAVSLTGRQLAFQSDRFAYRLTDGGGRIGFRAAEQGRPAQLDVDLYGVGGGQRLHIVGQVFDPKPAAAGWAQISGAGLEIDDRLIAACDRRISEASGDATSRVLASLKPSGKFNLTYWRIVREQPGGEPQTSMRLDLTDVRINYELFPYPLREIRGIIEARGNQWTFSDLFSGGRRTITAAGSLLPGAAGPELRLRITGTNVPLDDNLYSALQTEASHRPSPAQQAWQQLRPYGSINLTADIVHRVGQGRPNISIEIEPMDNCYIKPEFFPYLLDDLTGTITYNDGAISLEQLRASHDGVAMGANGQGYFAPDGNWNFRLTGLWADSLSARPDLLTALPPKLTRLIDQLRPTGTFSISNSELAFRQTAAPVPVIETAWDIQLECHQSDLNCGIPLDHITGSVRLHGSYDGQRSYSEGELALETVTYQDVQFTNVAGPLWLDEAQCSFGKHATDRAGKPSRRLTGKAYDGAVASDGWVRFAALPQYAVEADLIGVDLSRLMVERFRAPKPLQGKVDATVMLRGEGPAIEPLNGEGSVHIREANIYELPLLVRQLKLLRASVPDSTAFNESDVAFRIQGPHIYLDKINFLGDVVDLYGYGYANFNHSVKLIFRPELGPREYLLPGVKYIVSNTSQQVMQMYVDGTVDDPNVTTEAFPGINQVLQKLRIDLENPTGPAPRRQANRDMISRALGR
ncbi:MAG: hypothetical protein IT424_04940 [Pirellulales bacterium]|nr:hypothetical protein [Pirellulales bacterium]